MPICDRKIAESFADLGIPTFACSPDKFHDLMATAISRRDLDFGSCTYARAATTRKPNLSRRIQGERLMRRALRQYCRVRIVVILTN